VGPFFCLNNIFQDIVAMSLCLHRWRPSTNHLGLLGHPTIEMGMYACASLSVSFPTTTVMSSLLV
jgi:hypothetical protein